MAVTMGYVTWVSTRSGLRSHRDMMMTCVSPRSGIASRCMCVSDHQPKTQPTATARKIAALLRIDHSMIREITAEISPRYGLWFEFRLGPEALFYLARLIGTLNAR